MDQTHLILQSITLALASTLFVPALLREKSRGYEMKLLLIFVWFFGLNMYFNVTKMSLIESLFTAVGVGTIPFVAGWLFVTLTRKHFEDRRSSK